jgi:type I restriction enzyme S subunit
MSEARLAALPTGWRRVQLRALSAIPITAGVDWVADTIAGDLVRYIRTTDIAGLRTLIPKREAVGVPREVASQAPVHRGDLLMTRSGSLGTSLLYESDAPAAYAGYLVRVRPIATRVEPRFVAWWTLSRDHLDQISIGATKSTIENFSANKFRSMLVPLPAMNKQVVIADFLDRETAMIDALIDKLRTLAAGAEARAAGVTANLLATSGLGDTGPRLRHYVTVVRQGWSPQCNNWPAESGGWAVLKAGCVNGGIFRPEENKELPEELAPRPDLAVRSGELVVSRANTTDKVGSAAVVDDGQYPRLMLSDKLYAITLRPSANPQFVAFALATRRFRDLIELEATGVSYSMQNISQDVLLNLPMQLPDRNIQDDFVREIARRLADHRALISRISTLIALAHERRAALITVAVTGQLEISTGKVA